MSYVFLTKGDGVVSFGSYKPWSWHKMEGGDRSNYPEYSGRILDLKDGYASAVKEFSDLLEPELRDNIAIAIVPSHDPAKTGDGLAALAASLAQTGNRVDASGALIRTVKIAKLSHGGDRSIGVHLKSMAIAQPHLIAGRHVLLIDDVHRTGNSLFAGRKLLLEAGAQSVQCAALGRTG